MSALIEAARADFERWAQPLLGDNPTWRESGPCELAWQAWNAALAAAEAQPVGEPVAWEYWLPSNVTYDGQETIHKKAVSRFTDDTRKSMQRDGWMFEPLYTAPPAQPAAQPLTDEQISALVLETVYENDERIPYRDYWVREIGMPFARAIEAAHGIGSQP